MAYQGHGQHPAMSATFVPGGYDDFYMPAPGPELVSPAPQRQLLEQVDNIQSNLSHLELDAAGSRRTSSNTPQQPLANGYNKSSPSFHPQPSPLSPPLSGGQHQSYSSIAQATPELPNFSPFPKINPRPPSVPPSDAEKEEILENARLPVLNSNDPEMQLAWAQDALAYVAASQMHEERLGESRPARSVTPGVEHQLRVDAMNIVSFLAEQGHPKATFMKGMWLEFGSFGWRLDKREAFRCYARASEKSFFRADYRMGMQFEQNNDPVKALIHYQKGAATGDAASNYRLGMMTLMGQMGQPQDFAKGLQMLRIAAECADENAPQGAYVLGMLQARELPQVTVPEVLLPYDLREAKMNIEKAAYLGFAKAQTKMGSAYELCSLGCEFNPALSLHYNALAARQGDAEAEMSISKWFLCGYEDVFPKNEELAYEYAQRAAQAGLPTAEFALGYFNEIGVHVPVNLAKAREWYDRAAKNGNQDAIGRIQSLDNSQQLSKKDHENVAITRIKSQHGSMRGKRPDRFKAQAPDLPSIPDIQDPAIPPRGSSTTPYPMEDGPPQIAPLDRPPTVAPYPLDNGPPKIAASPGFAGGFAPELRSHSAAPQGHYRKSSGNAFAMNPALVNPQHDNGRFYSDQAGPGRPMLRPATSLSAVEVGTGGGRVPSGGSPRLHPMRYDSAPPAASRLSPHGPPLPGKHDIAPAASPSQRPLPGPQDIGYVAPLAPKKQSLLDQAPAARPPRTDSRPQTTSQNQVPSGSGKAKPAKASGKTPAAAAAGAKPASKPAAKPAAGAKPAVTKPAGTKPGKGPKTFDEMGVPAGKDHGDCTVM